mmetsp:Transcript_73704/g.196390  ORF Transcript_73704/g.196390 Transcript_73704/m.196390 type:complete len:311 (+) Transcript_73704:1293-2225(+)
MLDKLTQNVPQPIPKYISRHRPGLLRVLRLEKPIQIVLPLHDQLLHLLQHVFPDEIHALAPLAGAQGIFAVFHRIDLADAIQGAGHLLGRLLGLSLQTPQLVQIWSPMFEHFKLHVRFQDHHPAVVVHCPAVVGCGEDGDHPAVVPHLEAAAISGDLVGPDDHVQLVPLQKSAADVRAPVHAVPAPLGDASASAVVGVRPQRVEEGELFVSSRHFWAGPPVLQLRQLRQVDAVASEQATMNDHQSLIHNVRQREHLEERMKLVKSVRAIFLPTLAREASAAVELPLVHARVLVVPAVDVHALLASNLEGE